MDEFTVGLLYPQRGPAGLFGPSCLTCSTLAVDDINDRGGVLGRELVLRPIDAAAGPTNVARTVDALVADGAIDAVLGWHTSDVRQVLSAQLQQRVPYVYTALYEGGESTAGVFLTGETPAAQIRPALSWLQAEVGLADWFLVCSDYLWAQGSARACLNYFADMGARVCGARFLPLGTEDFHGVLSEIERSKATAVVMLLLGQDAVAFNRAFGASGLSGSVTRYSPLMDEHMLLASGPEATERLYASAGYFGSVVTPESMDFGARYYTKFGVDACAPTSMGESCFEGMLLLESLIGAAGTSLVADLMRCAPDATYDGARGQMRLAERHAVQTMYLAQAAGCDFEVLSQL